MSDKPRAILIAGPTASGKSALAAHLAARLGGVVINADSMQVYRELRIITARPTPADEAAVPHRLYGTVPAAERFSAGRWLAAAKAELDSADAAGLVPVFAGGTGLYFKALSEGLSDAPAAPEELLQNWRAEAERVGAGVLHAILAKRDPAMAAALEPSDAQRIVRALSVLEATGRSLLDFQREQAATPILERDECITIFLDPDRAWLYPRIDARFARMFEEGALEEARALLALGLDPSLPAMRAHGVPHLIAHLDGRVDLDRAMARATGDTRRYAKRQKTWFRHQMPGWRALPVDGDTGARALADAVLMPDAR